MIVRSVVGGNDWLYDRSHDATIDRAIDRCIPILIVTSVFGCHDWSYAPSQDITWARSTGHSMARLLVRSGAGGNDRLIVPSVADRHHWSYISRWSLPLVARFPAMAFAIDILQLFVIARPRVEIDHGSKNCRSVAPGPNRNQSYDPEIVRSGVTVSLVHNKTMFSFYYVIEMVGGR